MSEIENCPKPGCSTAIQDNLDQKVEEIYLETLFAFERFPITHHKIVIHIVLTPPLHTSEGDDTPHFLDCRRRQTGSLGRLLPRRVRGSARRSGLLLLLRLLPGRRRAGFLHHRARAVKLAHCLEGALHHPAVGEAPTGRRRQR